MASRNEFRKGADVARSALTWENITKLDHANVSS